MVQVHNYFILNIFNICSFESLHLWDQKPNRCARINLILALYKTCNLVMKSKTTYKNECIIASDVFVI